VLFVGFCLIAFAVFDGYIALGKEVFAFEESKICSCSVFV